MQINIFFNKHARKVPISMPRNPSLYYFVSFSIALVAPPMNKPESSKDLTIFKISSISLFDIINVVVAESKTFSWISASATDASYPNGSVNTLHKKRTFSLSISSVNVTKLVGNCRLDNIYWRNP